MTSQLKQFVEDLGNTLDLDLDINEFGTCMTEIATDVNVMIAHDEEAGYFYIETEIGEIPGGRYREQLLERALMSNGLPPPHYGTFGYLPEDDKLILHEIVPSKDFNTQMVAEIMEPYSEKAKTWIDAVQNAVLPVVEAPKKSDKGKGFFGGGLKL